MLINITPAVWLTVIADAPCALMWTINHYPVQKRDRTWWLSCPPVRNKQKQTPCKSPWQIPNDGWGAQQLGFKHFSSGIPGFSCRVSDETQRPTWSSAAAMASSSVRSMKPSCSVFLVSKSSSLSGHEGPREEVSQQRDTKDLRHQRAPLRAAFSFLFISFFCTTLLLPRL